MTPEVAWIVHHGILAVAIVVWFAAVLVHRRAFRAEDEFHPSPLREGEEKVEAPIGQVRDRLTEALRAGLGRAGTTRIEEAGDRRIRGTVMPLLVRGAQEAPYSFQVDLGTTAGGTRARWVLQGRGSRGLRLASRIFLYVLTPLAIAAAVIVMRSFVLSADDAAARAQAIQTVHVLHFVWPPFLFAWVTRRLTETVATTLRATIANTAF